LSDLSRQNNYYGIMFSLCGSLCFTTAMSIAKLLDPSVKGAVLVFIRCLFGLIFFLPFLIKSGVQTLKTQRPFLHILRVTFTCLSITCTYYGYRNLPLAMGTAIGFTAPLMTTALAILILKENVTLTKWLLIITGYLGVLVIVQPTEFRLNDAVYILLLANLFASLSLICAKKLTATESTVNIMFYVNVISTILSGIAASFVWFTPSLPDCGLLMLLGLFGVLAQFCYVKSLQHSAPSFLAPFDYSRLIIAVPIGFILFSEMPTLWTIFGAAIIIAATLFVTRLSLAKNIAT
jgi:drug/metabolite transporter (DMT)-like permease